MDITLETLQEEKILLQKDFDDMTKNIKKFEVDLAQMKANLNAINGAMQQTERLINKINSDDGEKQALKEAM